MTSTPHPRLAEVFALVVDAPQHERAALLDRECSGDPVLRLEVERLLALDASSATFDRPAHPIDGPPIVPAAAIEAALGSSARKDVTGGLSGTVVDEFTIEHEIGRGGCGVVYLAVQAPPEHRRVALKVVGTLATSPRFARRFEEERRALANLNHPGIARLYSGGTTAAGHAYFAMEFIAAADKRTPAPRITDFADAHELTVRQRVEMFVAVCDAVQHAHEQGIIHRDLKPSNILVQERDGRFQPKIIDFGIARQLEDDRHSPRAMLTVTGEVVGTPAYMSPEQTAGGYVDTRCDVYSLGVVLYELLCGTLPLPSLRRNAPLGEHHRAICEEQPVRPSKAVLRADVSTSTSRRTDAARLARQLRGDLDTILGRALEKDPARRFPTASALAEDLQRHLGNQPIQSRPHTLTYTLVKLTRRHRTFVAATALAFVSLTAAVVISLWLWRHSLRQEEAAQLMAAVAHLGAAQHADEKMDGAAIGKALDAVPGPLRKWEWDYLQSLTDGSASIFGDFDAETSALSVGGDDQRMLVGDRSGTTRMYDTSRWLRLSTTVTNPRPRGGGCDVWSVAWNPAHDLFATGSFDNVVRLHQADGSKVGEVRYPGRGAVYAVAFSPDGQRLAVGGGDLNGQQPHFVALLDVATMSRVWHDATTHKAPVSDVAFSSDRRWLASSSADRTVCLWRLDGDVPELVAPIPVGSKVNAVAFSPDCSLLAVGTSAWEVRLYGVQALELVCPGLQGHREALASVAFHPDGRSLASASWDSTIRIWSVPEGRQLDVLRGHRGRVNRVVFARDGTLFSASDDKTVRKWDPTRRSDTRSLRADKGILSLALLTDGDVVALTTDNRLRVLAAADGTVKADFGEILTCHFAISPDASTIAWRTAECVNTWRADRGKTSHHHPALARVRTIGAGALGDRHLLLACDAGLLRLTHATDRWDVLEPLPPACDGHEMLQCWLDADGRALATTWSNNNGSVFCTREGQADAVAPDWSHWWSFSGRHSVLLSQRGRELAVLDSGSSKLVATLLGHRERVTGVAFSPDDTRLASVGNDQTLRIWDWQHELQVLSIPYPTGDGDNRDDPARFSSVAWSHDGKTLLTGSTNGSIHFWPSRGTRRD